MLTLCKRCSDCRKSVQKNPSILLKKKINEFDCIAQSEAFANVCWNEDMLEAAIRAWWDLSLTDIDLSNINYRFIAYKQYV